MLSKSLRSRWSICEASSQSCRGQAWILESSFRSRSLLLLHVSVYKAHFLWVSSLQSDLLFSTSKPQSLWNFLPYKPTELNCITSVKEVSTPAVCMTSDVLLTSQDKVVVLYNVCKYSAISAHKEGRAALAYSTSGTSRNILFLMLYYANQTFPRVTARTCRADFSVWWRQERGLKAGDKSPNLLKMHNLFVMPVLKKEPCWGIHK